MITLNLNKVFQARGIDKGYTWMIKHGIAYHTANHILFKNPRSLRFDHIEILCKNLVCEPSDLFAYIPEKQDNLAETHPLNKLIRDKEEASLKQTISHLSYQELIEIKNFINTQKTEQKTESPEQKN